MSQPASLCPLHYRTLPEDFRAGAPVVAHTAYIVGGLYGNPHALREVLRLRDAETALPGSEAALVFNGDFHWLDCDPGIFSDINHTVLGHIATAGNIELELAQPSPGAGCGCNYPDSVPADRIALSDQVMDRLKACAGPAMPRELDGLPLHLTLQIGTHRIAVLHGDPESVAGWNFAIEAMPPPGDNDGPQARRIADWFRRADVDVFACSHTSTPFMQDFVVDGRRRVIANNGSAGMPNFAGRTEGVITRLSLAPAASADALYGTVIDDLHIEALPVRYAQAEWAAAFHHQWPAGSSADRLYLQRLLHGPDFLVADANRLQAARPPFIASSAEETTHATQSHQH